MTRKLVMGFFLAVVSLAAQAQAQDDGRVENGAPVANPPPPMRALPPEPEARADDLRLNGKCHEAIPILRALLDQGADAITQYHLGLCLFDIGKTEADAQRVVRLKNEAAGWIVKAANGGLPNAQESLVTIYLNGDGVDSDPVEAGKWSLVYHANGARMAIGMPDISPDLQARLDKALSEKSWTEAQRRAAAWAPQQ